MLAKKSAILFILSLTIIACNLAKISFAQTTVHNDSLPEAAIAIADYIADIKTAAIEFTQQDSEGNIAHGTLVIDKPYKFRCNYYKPFPLLIIGNKNYISVYDYEMKYIARIKTTENAFNFLLLDRIDFQNQFEILQITDQDNKYIMKFRSIMEDRISEIVFDKTLKQLKKLTIFEEDNHIVLTFGKNIKLSDLPGDLFILQNPDIFGPPQRLDQTELHKKLRIVK
jgi:outer membrane lipoprotein-sorting protein